MLIVNLFGAPSSGKSTGAAYIFSELKLNGINAELVTEFAKDKVWEESKETFNNQLYIFGEQYFRISRCEKKVDVIITDSPLLLSAFYNKNDLIKNELNMLVKKISDNYNSLNYFLLRDKPYNPIGRINSEAESNAMVDEMEKFLKYFNVNYQTKKGNVESYNSIIIDILKYIEDHKCKHNNLEDTGYVLCSNPPQAQYLCKDCGETIYRKWKI